MPEAIAKPVYMVDAYSDPVLVRVDGRASFQNSAALREFFDEMLRQAKSRFVLDLMNCTSMDSTFLGVLAGAALSLRGQTPAGSLVLSRVGPRNLELIRNLGLHRVLTVDAGDTPMNFAKCDVQLQCSGRSELENARLVLEAHETLISVEDANRAKFQDVLAFLKNRLEH